MGVEAVKSCKLRVVKPQDFFCNLRKTGTFIGGAAGTKHGAATYPSLAAMGMHLPKLPSCLLPTDRFEDAMGDAES